MLLHRQHIRQLFTRPYTPPPTERPNASSKPLSANGPTPAPYQNLAEREIELDSWIHDYTFHRPHASLNLNSPIMVESGNMPEFARENPHSFWEAADAFERKNGRAYTDVEEDFRQPIEKVVEGPIRSIEVAAYHAREAVGHLKEEAGFQTWTVSPSSWLSALLWEPSGRTSSLPGRCRR